MHFLSVLHSLHSSQENSLIPSLTAPESRGVMEPDLLDVVLSGGPMDGGGVALGVTETGGGVGMPEAAFSKSSTCREAGRLLLPPMRPLICCALDLQPQHQHSHSVQPTPAARVNTHQATTPAATVAATATSARIRTDPKVLGILY